MKRKNYVRRKQDASILYHNFTVRVGVSVNEPFSDAMNLSNIDFVYHFEHLARITERLPVVSSVKNLGKTFLIPGWVCVSLPRAALLLMEETKTV